MSSEEVYRLYINVKKANEHVRDAINTFRETGDPEYAAAALNKAQKLIVKVASTQWS